MQRTVQSFSPAALKAARRRSGRTLTELADLSDLSASTLSGWERGIVQPTVPTLSRVAGALSVGIADLLRSAPAQITLVEMRTHHGLTLDAAAESAGLSRTTVSRAENGTGALSSSTRKRLASLYAVGDDDIQAAWVRVRTARMRRLRATGT